jgi:hypothetical protein
MRGPLLALIRQGVHYGAFPGATRAGSGPGSIAPTAGHRADPRELATLWTVIRPHNWRPASSEEFLVELDAATGGG